jgi:cytochrome b561
MSTSRTTNPNPARYDRLTIRLHWAIVTLVALQWSGAELIDFVPGRAMHSTYWSVHIVLGLIFAAVVATHVWWRGTHGIRLPDSNEEGWRAASRTMHAALNLIPPLLVFLGLSIILARGWVLFGVFKIPALPGSSRHLARTITEIHQWTAHVLVFLASAHAVAALFHHYGLRDGVLRRMMPSASAQQQRAQARLG